MSVLRIPLSHWFIRVAFDLMSEVHAWPSPPGFGTCWAKTVDVASRPIGLFFVPMHSSRNQGDGGVLLLICLMLLLVHKHSYACSYWQMLIIDTPLAS